MRSGTFWTDRPARLVRRRSQRTRLDQLAIDLAEWAEVPVDVAKEAIRTGLIGEHEPLREFSPPEVQR